MDRFFLSLDEWGKSPVLVGDEAHHCCRVMRKKEGELIEIFDGEGRMAEARILTVSKNEVGLEILWSDSGAAAVPQIEIAVGIPKGKNFELILQKAVEMGVSRIQPLMSEQGNVRFRSGEGEVKREKWQRAVLEACKQCGQNYLPEVAVPLTVEAYVEGLDSEFPKFVGALTEGGRPFRECLSEEAEPRGVILLIGPEGDFSAGEYEQAFEAGFKPVDLGELVLRTETAVFWMTSAVRFYFQV